MINYGLLYNNLGLFRGKCGPDDPQEEEKMNIS